MGKAETVKLSGGIRVKLNESFNLLKFSQAKRSFYLNI